MPQPTTTASATIRINRARETGPDLRLECLVRLVSEPHAQPPSWPRQLAKAFREGLLDFDNPSPRISVPDRDPSMVRLVWAPLPEPALWSAIKLLGELLEFHILALGRIAVEVDLR